MKRMYIEKYANSPKSSCRVTCGNMWEVSEDRYVKVPSAFMSVSAFPRVSSRAKVSLVDQIRQELRQCSYDTKYMTPDMSHQHHESLREYHLSVLKRTKPCTLCNYCRDTTSHTASVAIEGTYVFNKHQSARLELEEEEKESSILRH